VWLDSKFVHIGFLIYYFLKMIQRYSLDSILVNLIFIMWYMVSKDSTGLMYVYMPSVNNSIPKRVSLQCITHYLSLISILKWVTHILIWLCVLLLSCSCILYTRWYPSIWFYLISVISTFYYTKKKIKMFLLFG
jgi:hypothetical protein